jgi:hypothetical protein
MLSGHRPIPDILGGIGKVILVVSWPQFSSLSLQSTTLLAIRPVVINAYVCGKRLDRIELSLSELPLIDMKPSCLRTHAHHGTTATNGMVSDVVLSFNVEQCLDIHTLLASWLRSSLSHSQSIESRPLLLNILQVTSSRYFFSPATSTQKCAICETMMSRRDQ